jgi:ribonuclease Z
MKMRTNRRQFIRDTTIAAAMSASLRVQAATGAAVGMRITVLGDSSCTPDVGHEAACLLINGKHLVDTGWCAVLKMRQYGFDPMALESLILTHFHQDHYIGLPQLLFYLGLHKRRGAPLKILGPREHLEPVVKAAVEFLQTSRFPELALDYRLVPLAAGDRSELADLHLESFAARHVSAANRLEPALVYKVTDKVNGACAVLTGDTHYHPPIAEFAKGVPLLIHDGVHTAPKDAASIARRAEVGRLVLIHFSQSRAARTLAEASAVFAHTELAKEGTTLEVPALR